MIQPLKEAPEIDNQTKAISAVLTEYLEGMLARDQVRVANVFYPQSQMFIVHSGQLLQLPVFPGLMDYLAKTPEDPGATAFICQIDVTNDVASAKVEVVSNGAIFTDYFALLETGGEWKIINKVFTTRAVEVKT